MYQNNQYNPSQYRGILPSNAPSITTSSIHSYYEVQLSKDKKDIIKIIEVNRFGNKREMDQSGTIFYNIKKSFDEKRNTISTEILSKEILHYPGDF